MTWKLIRNRFGNVMAYDSATHTVEKVPCGGKSYIWSLIRKRDGYRIGPIKQLSYAKALAQQDMTRENLRR